MYDWRRILWNFEWKKKSIQSNIYVILLQIDIRNTHGLPRHESLSTLWWRLVTLMILHMNTFQLHRNPMILKWAHGHSIEQTKRNLFSGNKSQIVKVCKEWKNKFFNFFLQLTSISDPDTLKFLYGGSRPLINSKILWPFLYHDTLYNIFNSMLCLHCNGRVDPFSTNFFVFSSTSTSTSDSPSLWNEKLCISLKWNAFHFNYLQLT